MCDSEETITGIKIVGPFCPCSLWACSFISRHLINESALIVRRTGFDVESISLSVERVEWNDKIIAYYSIFYLFESYDIAIEDC